MILCYSLVIKFSHFLWGSHKSTLAITTISQICGVTKLHISILYLFTVSINRLIRKDNISFQKKMGYDSKKFNNDNSGE